eukprot:520620-Prymnesium_polylepis.1
MTRSEVLSDTDTTPYDRQTAQTPQKAAYTSPSYGPVEWPLPRVWVAADEGAPNPAALCSEECASPSHCGAVLLLTLTCSCATAGRRCTACHDERKMISASRSSRHRHDRRARRDRRRTTLKIDSEPSIEDREPLGAAGGLSRGSGDADGDLVDERRASRPGRSERASAARIERTWRMGL